MSRRDEQEAIEVTEYLGWEYQPPITPEERKAWRGTIRLAVIGYCCWIVIGLYFFGG